MKNAPPQIHGWVRGCFYRSLIHLESVVGWDDEQSLSQVNYCALPRIAHCYLIKLKYCSNDLVFTPLGL